jgi:glucose/arabinose dehydrogenase
MKGWARLALITGCLVAMAAAPRAAAVSLQPFGTFDQPVFATSPPGDPRLFVVERPGRIQVLHDGTRTQFLDIHTMVATDGERGLLSMAFDPDYASNGLFYVFFNDNGSGGASAGDIHVDEFHVGSDPNVANPGSRRQVLTIGHSSAGNHNGGQLEFGEDGLLYISVGEAGDGSNAQTLSNALGKVLRIDPHGAGPGAHGIPVDNPFLGSPTPEIWSMGLRNPFRFSFDALTGDLVIADVGQTQWEEVDLSPAASGLGRGANYGWPACEGFVNQGTLSPCSAPGTTLPVFAYSHSDPGGDAAHGCAIIGGYVYRGTQAPEIAGRYLYADLCTAELRSIQLGLPLASGDRPESAPGALTSPRSFGEDSACNVYVMNMTTLFRIVGSGGTAASACPSSAASPTPTPIARKKRKCKKHRHKRKHRAAEAKHKKHRKKCKKRKKRWPVTASLEQQLRG